MLFSSMVFLWCFLPIVLGGYYLIHVLPIKDPQKKIKYKNYFLLVASLFFYGWGGAVYLLLMLFVILTDYVAGFFVAKQRKSALVLALAANLGVLFVFKYLGMFTKTNIALPIGISFYTFQAISYVVDVYRKRVPLQKNFLLFALYVSLFPQLIAGPIVVYRDVEKQILKRQESVDGFVYGIKRFSFGLGKKVLLANTFAVTADKVWDMTIADIGAPLAWAGMIAYTLQIYYDFSGYSDMAIGLGSMFGFSFKENFNYPYTAISIQDFWRRWHMSLSSFFKDYVYIPLGGSREGELRTYRNLLIVFALTGIWHGANYTFWVWGMYYGVILIMERLFLGELLKKNPVKLLNHIYSVFIVMIGWVMFRSASVFEGLTYIAQLFSYRKMYTMLSVLNVKVWIALPIALLCCGFIQRIFGKAYERHKNNRPVLIMETAFEFCVFILSVFCVAGGTYNPFIYFQF